MKINSKSRPKKYNQAESTVAHVQSSRVIKSV